MNSRSLSGLAFLGSACLPLLAVASSHREAPAIAGSPRVDGTDFYMFRSYEPGRSDFVTFLANYIPFQDPQGGPNFYNMDEKAVYAINVDNDGSGRPDLTFEFRFKNTAKNLAVPAGDKKTAVPVINIGPVDVTGKNLNVVQSYTLKLVRDGNTANSQPIENETAESTTFYRPTDNIGHKSIPNYPDYASHFIYNIEIPGCATPGRVFVGQRKEGFFINVGEIFDLVNMNPIGPRDGKKNDLSLKNVTSIALEVPISCLTRGKDPVIGGWTTASLDEGHQVSRLGMPLVNEVVIGLPDKDKFNESMPSQDAQFLNYVTNPSLPVLLHVLFGDAAKEPGTPRNDLVAVFLTGIKGLNQPMRVNPSEMMRLNTSIAPTAPAKQNDLGILGGDSAGFPNGRRPYDDVVDITLRVAEGAACGVAGNCGSETKDPNHGAPYTDGVRAAGPDEAHVRVSGKINPDDVYLSAISLS
ncbi:MAG TPA: DUF4331 domain-containing protein [Steroidobacteraceae bacterium]|jgi:hypothetical protein|nr:DUF4331 domain-containing protein [Steroidobacteraceae bacterium]